MRDPGLYVEDILEAIRRIEGYVDGLTFDDFSRDQMVVDAVVRNFEVIGEASKRVPVGTRRGHPGVPWGIMAGMRDKLIHAYFGVDVGVLWATVKEDIPALRDAVEELLRELESK